MMLSGVGVFICFPCVLCMCFVIAVFDCVCAFCLGCIVWRCMVCVCLLVLVCDSFNVFAWRLWIMV